MQTTRLAPNLCVLHGAVNTGVLIADRRALLLDCCDTVTPERLATLGVETVELILCTQHRRPNTAGAYRYVVAGARVIAPVGERQFFEGVTAYWNDWWNRWHVFERMPGLLIPTRPLPVVRGVGQGDVIEWQGFSIHVLDTPGATDGSVSYQVKVGDQTFCFCGDTLYGPGQLWDLYSLQRGFGCVGDYHGFLGHRQALVHSLEKLAGCGADILVPAHGAPMREPQAAIGLTLQRLEAAWRNYTAVSALNHYFPTLFDDTRDDARRMVPASTYEPPAFVRRVAATSFAILSETGAAFLIDCGHDVVVDTLLRWIQEGHIQRVEGCWATHYHFDHVDALGHAAKSLGCPIITDQHMAEIIEHPVRFFLPCLSSNAAPVARATREGETWPWHEFQFTAFHFPGQTLYHSGLLVEGHGVRVLFAGDSLAPTGLDDYCAGNRNLLGAGRGLRRCLELVRRLKPDYIFNQHQDRPFSFSTEQLHAMEAMLVERERLLATMLPWAHPDFGTDEYWVRTYPFEQEAWPGSAVALDVQFTNHGPAVAEAEVKPVLPEGWRWERGSGRVCVPAQTDGLTESYGLNPDRAARVWIAIPEGATTGRYVIPFRITWDGRYLGQVRHAIVVVR